VGDRTDWSDQEILGDDGVGVLDLSANPSDQQKDVPVTFDYVIDGVASPTITTTLAALLDTPAAAGTAPAE
jgi:hypothetical protein